ncbi:MAG TPA: electron transfer flavoprotein subunit alpha/FixB family protein, partial [Bacillota bacterium]
MILVAGPGGTALPRSARELLNAASQLGAAAGIDIVYAALGAEAATAAQEAGAYGVKRAIAVEGDLAPYGAEGYLLNLERISREVGATWILLPGDLLGRELAPRLAARLGGAALNDAIEVRREGERVVWTRPVFGGKALADVVLNRTPGVITLRPGAFAAAEPTGGSVAVETMAATLPDERVKIVERKASEQRGPRLEEARVVVSGGRGMGGPEPFKNELRQLAEIFGGAVGASLAAVDEGWASPEMQVGQTGTMVSPDVYFAIGISGASQHLAGISGAKAVVAINKDENA